MRIIVPYVPGMLHERTQAWADDSFALQWELSADDEAYFRLLRAEWREPGDLAIVEQDMLPAPGVVDRMSACKRPWCVSPYTIGGERHLTEGLGCTKFAGRLKQRHPDLMERVGEIDDDGMPARDWRRLDTRIARLLRERGYAPHVHARSQHLHDYRTRP